MLPKAKAEWERSYQALLAHERGHEKLVHDYFDGLANKILGKTRAAGQAAVRRREVGPGGGEQGL